MLLPCRQFDRRLPTLQVLLAILLMAGVAAADVIVLANRTGGPVAARFTPRVGEPRTLRLEPGDVVPLFQDGGAQIEFNSAGGAKRYGLDPNSAYYFGRNPQGQVDLQKIGLGEAKVAVDRQPLPGSAIRTPSAVIPVKILVDDDEPGLRHHWERRLRNRIEAASAILERHARIGLRVVAVDTWHSDNANYDFTIAMAEFEREVAPQPATLAIGFSSQWAMVQGRIHMAGTRGPLHTHVLVRENAPHLTEPEKLEFLVHELGHYLGAGHSPERNSVMRPVLGDKQAGRSGFRIQFDPVNTLIIAMVGEEIRRRRVTRFAALTPATQVRLRQIYAEVARVMPRDPTLKQYLQATGRANPPPVRSGQSN